MSKIEFKRGDGADHSLLIPAANWSSGGKLFFAAKPAVDDDSTDANAVIQCSWDDSAVSDTTQNGIAYKKYSCHFPGSATNSIVSNGATSADYLGEFQWVPVSGDPISFPGDDEFIDVTVYFDIKRKTT